METGVWVGRSLALAGTNLCICRTIKNGDWQQQGPKDSIRPPHRWESQTPLAHAFPFSHPVNNPARDISQRPFAAWEGRDANSIMRSGLVLPRYLGAARLEWALRQTAVEFDRTLAVIGDLGETVQLEAGSPKRGRRQNLGLRFQQWLDRRVFHKARRRGLDGSRASRPAGLPAGFVPRVQEYASRRQSHWSRTVFDLDSRQRQHCFPNRELKRREVMIEGLVSCGRSNSRLEPKTRPLELIYCPL